MTKQNNTNNLEIVLYGFKILFQGKERENAQTAMRMKTLILVTEMMRNHKVLMRTKMLSVRSAFSDHVLPTEQCTG